MCALKILGCILSSFILYGDCARILGIVPTASYSHQVVFQPIWKELSLRGHQVTTMTTDLIKDPTLTNLTEIDLHASYDIWNKKIAKITNENMFNFLILIMELMEEIGHYQFSHPEVQDLINSDTKKFDLVMIEYSFLPMFAFASKFKAPLIVMTSVEALSDLRQLMGSPIHPIAYPDSMFTSHEVSTITGRSLIVFLRLFLLGLFKLFGLSRQQIIADQYFGNNNPPLEELLKNISLVLTNSDPIFHGVKPLVPTIVRFGGGSHRTPPKPLPADLQTILDEAENGFIYFSLGSNVKSKDLSKDTRETIMQAFEELPYTILWKFEVDDLPNKAKNVITSKWLPQQDILKHPKIKLFITQGGLQSMDEAIYDHVPMIGMPFFADQEFNVNKMVKMGFGLSINHRTMDKQELKTSIFEVINNPKYKNVIKTLAELAVDQPMTGLETAIWWTEYVIRHNGTKHLRSPMLDIPFYQYFLLDVIAVLGLTLIVLTFVLIFSVKLLFRLLTKLIPTKKTKVS